VNLSQITGRFGLLVGLGALAVLAGCSEAPVLEIRPTNRVVLAEYFTWMRCGYCPYAARALDSVVADFEDSLVVIAYHRRVAGDTLSPEYVESRKMFYYSTNGEPATVFDGGEVVWTPGPEYNYSTFRGKTVVARNVVPGAQLGISATAGDSVGTVAVWATGVSATPTATLKLFVVLVEDSVHAHLLGAYDTTYRHVMRQMLPGVEGEPVNLAVGDTVVKEYGFRFQSFWSRPMMGVVAFVQNSETHEVLQAACLSRIEPQRRFR
jgi:thiol-disulfide isomerase/thioredoxin